MRHTSMGGDLLQASESPAFQAFTSSAYLADAMNALTLRQTDIISSRSLSKILFFSELLSISPVFLLPYLNFFLTLTDKCR
jgi:hypothetical protein